MRIARSLASVAAILLWQVAADVELVTPAAGASVAAGAITLVWQDSGAYPVLGAISAADIVLCTGTDAAITTLYTIAGSVPMSTETSLAVTIPATIGTNGQYFLKFVETTASGEVVTTYSDRFTLTGMTGTAVANTGLATTAPAGTTPAAALLETVAATAKAAAATTASVSSVNLAAYASQTGRTHTGPPQGAPGSTITANAATVVPAWPTSAYSIFTTHYAIPYAVTTLTASPQKTFTSLANTRSAATFTSN